MFSTKADWGALWVAKNNEARVTIDRFATARSVGFLREFCDVDHGTKDQDDLGNILAAKTEWPPNSQKSGATDMDAYRQVATYITDHEVAFWCCYGIALWSMQQIWFWVRT